MSVWNTSKLYWSGCGSYMSHDVMLHRLLCTFLTMIYWSHYYVIDLPGPMEYRLCNQVVLIKKNAIFMSFRFASLFQNGSVKTAFFVPFHDLCFVFGNGIWFGYFYPNHIIIYNQLTDDDSKNTLYVKHNLCTMVHWIWQSSKITKQCCLFY